MKLLLEEESKLELGNMASFFGGSWGRGRCMRRKIFSF